MAPSCYYTCSLVPASLLAAAGYRPVRLMPRELPVQSSKRNVLSPHSMNCPYVTGLLPLAEAALDANANAPVVVPSGCDAMRRAGELLSAAFPGRVFALPVPRVGGGSAAGTLARDLQRLLAWLQASPPREPFGGEAELAGLSYPSSPTPGGVFVISGPLDGPALLDLLEELGADVCGVESCSSEERLRGLDTPPSGSQDLRVEDAGAETDAVEGGENLLAATLLPLAQAVLDTAVCPRRPAAERRAYLRRRWQQCRPGAVLYARHSFCDPGAYDLLEVAELAREAGLPFLEVEVGLPLEITGPLRTRVEAFLETLLLDF